MSADSSIAVSEPRIAKGKLSWVVPLFEVVTIIGYFLIGWNAITELISTFDIVGFFENIVSAIYFLIVCTIITTVMCFLPAFRSKSNTRVAIWNIVWLAANLFGMMTS